MGYVRHMDYTLNTQVHKAVKNEAIELSAEFYAVADTYVLRRLEGAFTCELQSFTEYGVRGATRHSAHHRNEVRKLIDKAVKLLEKEKSNGSQTHTA